LAQREKTHETVVLLSPACASYDQFPNFEERGREFERLVNDLPGKDRQFFALEEASL
jgi:UDP-N-acetylmuramoylalanine--D-glutamate ligase